jgi:hypothetical protein
VRDSAFRKRFLLKDLQTNVEGASVSLSNVMYNALSGMQTQTTRPGSVTDANVDSGPADFSMLDFGSQNAGPGEAETNPTWATSAPRSPLPETPTMSVSRSSYTPAAAAFESGADLWDILMSVKRD